MPPPDVEPGLRNAVYDWASKLTAESRMFAWIATEYHWPAEIKELYNRLLRSKRELIAVLGHQGVGKTSAMQALEFEFNRELWVEALERTREGEKKSESHAKARAIALNYSDLQGFLNLTRSPEELRLLLFDQLYVEELNRMLRLKRIRMPLVQSPSREDVEIILGAGKCRAARVTSVLRTAQKYEHLLIDLPDYSKTDRRLMARDLDRIQELWRGIMSKPAAETNVVIFMQEETFRGHFFFGKMDVVKLEPFRAEELVSSYVEKFKHTDPFTPEALLRIAKLSRGIFRRFLQYIKLTMDWQTQSGDVAEPISVDTVEKAVTKKQLEQDMDQELSELFPKNMEARTTAIDILDLLQKEPLNQKTMAEQLEIPEYKLSRILQRLETGQWIEREKTGLDKIVKLKDQP